MIAYGSTQVWDVKIREQETLLRVEHGPNNGWLALFGTIKAYYQDTSTTHVVLGLTSFGLTFTKPEAICFGSNANRSGMRLEINS